MSQPAFSRRIRALEDEVGVGLINRQSLPLSPTPAGEIFLNQAKIILRTYEETLEKCQVVDAANENVIRFATSQSLYMSHFKTRVMPLVEQGGLEIDLNSTSWSADQFVTALLQRYCDAILTYWHPSMDFLSPLEVSKCEYVTLATDRFLPVSKAGMNGPMHVLTKGQKKPAPILSYGSASALRTIVENTLAQHLDPPKIVVMNQNAQAISVKAMILEGFGIGWLPAQLCKEELAAGQMQIAGDESFISQIEVRLYRHRENSKSTLNKLWSALNSETVLAAE